MNPPNRSITLPSFDWNGILGYSALIAGFLSGACCGALGGLQIEDQFDIMRHPDQPPPPAVCALSPDYDSDGLGSVILLDEMARLPPAAYA